MSGVALLAQAQGYAISGCDLESSTPYLEKLKKTDIKIYQGQDSSHLKGVDLVTASPAVFFQNADNPEVIEAKKKGLMTWQEFLGKYLQKDKEVICVAGTHGKSTTTSMLSLLFEDAGLDPWAMIGANVPKWNSNARVGKNEIFITESDEFYDSFLNYSPQVIILNNIELDHPDYFKSEDQLFESFSKHIKSLYGKKILVFNQDSAGIKKLFIKLGKEYLSTLNLVGYSLKGKQINLDKDQTSFVVGKDKYVLMIPGKINIANALGVIVAAKFYNIPSRIIQKSLMEYGGIDRRLELLGEKNGIKIYDDYAHHPTAIAATLEALRQKYTDKLILAVIEPHTFSRTKVLLDLYKDAFVNADEVIVAPIFRSRDTKDFGINGQNIVAVSKHNKISYIDSFGKIVEHVKANKQKYDVIVVMGAGKSYQLARDVLSQI